MPTNRGDPFERMDHRFHRGSFGSRFVFFQCPLDSVEWYRFVELKPYSRLGLGYYQLRVVGRYRSRRYVDFSNPFVVSSKMADRCEPCSRSDDDFCGYLCGSVPDYSHGTCLDGTVHLSLSKHTWSVVAKL